MKKVDTSKSKISNEIKDNKSIKKSNIKYNRKESIIAGTIMIFLGIFIIACSMLIKDNELIILGLDLNTYLRKFVILLGSAFIPLGITGFAKEEEQHKIIFNIYIAILLALSGWVAHEDWKTYVVFAGIIFFLIVFAILKNILLYVFAFFITFFVLGFAIKIIYPLISYIAPDYIVHLIFVMLLAFILKLFMPLIIKKNERLNDDSKVDEKSTSIINLCYLVVTIIMYLTCLKMDDDICFDLLTYVSTLSLISYVLYNIKFKSILNI